MLMIHECLTVKLHIIGEKKKYNDMYVNFQHVIYGIMYANRMLIDFVHIRFAILSSLFKLYAFIDGSAVCEFTFFTRNILIYYVYSYIVLVFAY